jgi:hypothetical protein
LLKASGKATDDDCARLALDQDRKRFLEVGDVATFQNYDRSLQSLCFQQFAGLLLLVLISSS